MEPLEENNLEFNSFASLNNLFNILDENINKPRVKIPIEKLDVMAKKMIISRLLSRMPRSEFMTISKGFIIKYLNSKHRALKDPY
jgi:hypothetical protein